MLQDFRYALRALARSRVFTIVAVLSLALGIGANTAIFSLLDQVLLRSLPISRPEELVAFHWPAPQMGRSQSDCGETTFSYPLYRDLRDRSSEVFQGVAARTGTHQMALSYKGATDRAIAEIVSGNFFEVLGARAQLGRVLTPEDDVMPSGHPVAVLSHGSWTRRFGADPAILNQKITINGHPMTVIGVMPERFAGLLASQMPDVFVPIAMKREVTPAWDDRENRRVMWLNVFARLKPGLTREQAEAKMAVILRPLAESELSTLRSPSARYRKEFLDAKLDLRPAARGISNWSSWHTSLIVLMVLVGLVLLIACANVAGLLVARAAGRQREFAVRLSLGASRGALIRQLGVESLILAVAGGVAGLALAAWTTEFLPHFLPNDEFSLLQFHADSRVLGFTCAISLLAALLFGLAPALQAAAPTSRRC